ncbi:hypothetical protein HF888_07815 [Bermanella marisrubri]|uniref:hypothetical protein n=1 Tax=Bermanella marisrubri TaxID=207949 RepID=UPI0010596CCD|nr:hypothetical protein [Bermanella marisrubri]QIZ82716.1 hypothetical protein HF888_07815 [Bermanella marisrubri]
MVAKRICATRCKATLHLIPLLTALLVSACSQPTTDIVTLQHRSAQSLAHILERHIDDPDSYSISGNQIIFYDPSDNQQELVHLLKKLDKGPVSYRLHITPDNIKRYSTSTLPDSIILMENEPSIIQTGKTRISMRIRPLSANSAILSITEINDQEQIAYHYNLETPFNQWINTGLNIGLDKLKVSQIK